MSFSAKTPFYVNELLVELRPMDLCGDKAKLTILLYHGEIADGTECTRKGLFNNLSLFKIQLVCVLKQCII